AGVGVVALGVAVRPAGCPCSLEAVVVTHASLALVLVRALGTGVAAVRSVRFVVRVAASGTVAGVRVVALGVGTRSAGCPCSLEAVFVTPSSLALVLVRALCTGVAAVPPVPLVVPYTTLFRSAGVGVVALGVAVRPAGCPCSLEAVVVTHASLALVLV